VGNPTAPFTGVYDGDNHYISNAVSTVNISGVQVCGMFGVVQGGTVKNLKFSDCSTTVGTISTTAPCGVGNAVGAIDGGTISGIEVADNQMNVTALAANVGVGGVVGSASGTVAISGCKAGKGSYALTVGGRTYSDLGIFSTTNLNGNNAGVVGGILGAGNSTGVSIDNCVNEMNIRVINAISGGIAGQNASVSNSYNTACLEGKTFMGGIVGQINFGAAYTIESCYNTGELNILNNGTASNLGGILGATADLSGVRATVNKCFNSASFNIIMTTRPLYIGGIVANANSRNVVITNCYNTGDIYSASLTAPNPSFCGGIVGNFNNSGTYTKQVTNCYTTGKVSGADLNDNTTSSIKAVVIGNTNATAGVTVSDIFYTTDYLEPTTAKCTGAVIGGLNGGLVSPRVTKVTTAELGSPDTFADPSWDFATAWDAPTGAAPYPYPQIKGLPHVDP